MHILSAFVILFLTFVYDVDCAISDKRLCGDPACSDVVSYAKTLIRYTSDDARILSFQGNVKVKVFSKSAGSKPGLWGVEINGKRGYAPKDFIREYQVVKGKLDYVVSTSDDTLIVNTPDGVSDEQDSQADISSERKEESPPESGDGKANLPPFPDIGVAAEELQNDIVSSSETLEPYEVADGTTIYFSTEAPGEPVLIQATTTDSGIQATVRSQLDPAAEQGNSDKPNPSIMLPQPTTSSEVIKEKEENEGSAEKIYQYLLSNFMPEQGSGEPVAEETLDAENKPEEVERVTDPQKDVIESTESASVSVNIDAAKPAILESDGTAKHQVLLTTAGIDTSEKLASDESLEDDDENDDEDLNDDEEYVDSAEDITVSSEDPVTESSPSTDSKDDTAMPAVQRYNEISDSVDTNTANEEPNNIEMKTKLEIENEIEADGASTMIQDNPLNTFDGESTKTDSDKSLDPSSNYLNELFKDTHNDTQMDGLPSIENSSNVESTDNHVIEPQDLGDLANNNPEGETKSQLTEQVNSDSSYSLLINTNDSKIGIDEAFPEQNMTQEPEINLSLSSQTVDEQNTSTQGKTPDSEALAPIGSDNLTDLLVDEDGSNNIHTSQNVDTVGVEQEFASTPADIPPSTVMEADPVSDSVTEDDSDLTTRIPVEDSTETAYIVDLDEDSPVNVVTDMPAVNIDDATEAVTEDVTLDDATGIPDDDTQAMNEDDPGTSGGFFSNVFGWLRGSGSPSPSEDPETERDEEKSKSETEDSPRNSVWSYTKLPDREADQHPQRAPSCLADSGSDPNCDHIGSEPRVASYNEETTQQIMTDQEHDIPHKESGESRSSSEILSYLGITAVSMVVIILGHWFIEKMRCDSAYIKRINDLERALLYAELESKNLKIDMEEFLQKGGAEPDKEMIEQTEQQLAAYIDECGSLQGIIELLEAKNATLQSSLDEATQAGLDLNRMLSDLLATNEGSESLIGTVNDMQKELNEQLETISQMKIDLNAKENESATLTKELTEARAEVTSMSEELKVVTNTLNDFLVEKYNLEGDYRDLRSDCEAKLKLQSEHEEKLSKEIAELQEKITRVESEVSSRDIELLVLRDCITKFQVEGKLEEEEFKRRYNFEKGEATCRKLEKENRKLSEALQEEKDVRLLLEGHVNVINSEVSMLRKAAERSEKEKLEAVTKHAVLADYFKDKETQLQKELGYRDALYEQTKGDATSTHEEVKLLAEQVASYKDQIETLKKEIVDQERGFKNQILAFEKKSQDNWLTARQTERKLQETKQEASILRNRLTLVETNALNALHSDKAPTGTSEREMLETGMGSQGSPLLYPVDTNVNSGDVNAAPFSPFVPSSGLVSPRSPINYPVDENLYLNRSTHASPANISRARPAMNPITFTSEEARDPNSPYFGILNPQAPYDPFYGKPIQDKNNPELYHLLPLVAPLSGPTSLILPPPVLPNLNTHDRRPPPLGRMSSPPMMSPPPPRHGRMSPPYSRRMSPPARRHHGHRYRRASPPPRRDHSPEHDRDRERRPSASPQDRVRRNSATLMVMEHSIIGQERVRSPEHLPSYRRRSPSPSRRYSDSSDSDPESSRRGRRYDYYETSSYRSRSPSPPIFRPISRETTNNQGSSARSSNHSFESDECNRRNGRP